MGGPGVIGGCVTNPARPFDGQAAPICRSVDREWFGGVRTLALVERPDVAHAGGYEVAITLAESPNGRAFDLLGVYEQLSAGKRAERSSLDPRGLLRISMPRKPTGLDLAFPRATTDDS